MLDRFIRHIFFHSGMSKRKRRNLDDLLGLVLEQGPKALAEERIRLHLGQAEDLSVMLALHGIDVEPYDFPRTFNVWSGPHYRYQAMRQLLACLAERSGVDPQTFEGFKYLLPLLRKAVFSEQPINRWGTTLAGMLNSAYADSPSAAVLDLVYHDSAFREIKKHTLQPYDFPQSPNNTWIDEAGKPTITARRATKEIMTRLAEQEGVDYRTPDGFKRILPHLTTETFSALPINVWGTTLTGMLAQAYAHSPSAAVLDLIAHDEDFCAIRQHGLEPYDFPRASRSWHDQSGRLTLDAMAAVKKLVIKKAGELGVTHTTPSGFSVVIDSLGVADFYGTPINYWGTTLNGILWGDHRSHYAVLLDLVQRDDDFKKIRDTFTWPDKAQYIRKRGSTSSTSEIVS